uniref:Germinal-center associated nuclear protein-like n=1 Tax=Saccoglossus kowalevskii TaxID=10224 RepID=A0ABM0LYP6_SACKO|nr:PREDICTED: germinal-center associated nuclear protein-like [Saccoglossus kowalevskii]
MNRSYSVPNHPTQYPLQDLLRILAFQDNEEATEFCEEHGLAVSNGCVQFDRSTFIHPEISITAKRSLFIIESKNTSCIGEVVNGGPLSDYELHRPVSSFDSNDRYIGDNTTSKVSDIVSQEKTAIDVKPQPSSPVYIPPVPPVPVMVPPTLDMICSDEVIKNIARELFLDVINESALQISQAYVSSVHLFINVSNIAMETILEEVSYDMTKDMIVDAIRVEELQEEQKRITAAEYERSKNDSIQDIFHEMIDETVHDQCRDLSLRQMRDVKESLKNESIERVGTSLIVDLVDDCVSKECQAISHKTLQEEETLRDLKLSSISDTVQRRIRGRFFKSIANDWLEISDRILLHRNKIEVLKEAVWKAMDLPQLILKALDKHKKNDCFWKLVLSLPEDDYGCHDNKLLIEWMEAKLSRGKLKEEVHDKVKTLSLYTSVNNVNHMEKISVSVCTKAIKGDLSVTGSVHVLGTSGIIFTLPKLPEEKNLQLDYWLLCKSRLESLLKNKPWIPSVPVVIVLLDWTSTYNIQYQCVEELHLNELKESGLLSVYSIVNLSSDIMDMDNVQQFSDCLQWLATSRPLVPKLTANTLQDYLECGVVEYFITPLLQDTVNYPCEITQDPNRYASLYNSVLEHLLQRITSDELCNISWPIPEFTAVHTEPDLPTVSWNSDKNHQKFKSVISSCQLPWIPTLPKTDSWNDVFTIVLRYIDNLPKRPGQDKTALYSRVKWLLRRSFEDYKYSDYLDSSFDQSLWKHVPFNLIIESCVAYMIQSVKYADIIWVYYEDKSDRYRPPVLSTVNVAPCADVSDAEEEEDSAVLTQSSNIKICNPKLEQTIQNVNDLEQLMIQEKRHSDSYDSQLQKWLNEPHTDVRFQELLPSGRRESYQSLSEKIEELEEKVNMSRRAERLSEITLNSWLQY